MLPAWMFGFGNIYPYTNFHDLNLDWIIAVCKDLTDKFPDVVRELLLKLNAPEQAGEVGQFLVNLGEGKTGWQDINEDFAPVIIEAVNEWLTDHPEATTTVQNASLTLAKMTEETAYTITRKESGILAPVYIGDYMTTKDYVPSATKYVNGYFYCVNAPTDAKAIAQGNGFGKVAVYDVQNNVKYAEYDVLTGHGNSIAYDGTYFYIAPIWEYTSNGKTSTNKIYKYTDTFILVAEIDIPQTIMGLSYDEVTRTLYALDYSGVIYKIDTQVTTYTTITNWYSYYNAEDIKFNRYYNQDIAINNDEFYISSPWGNILHGKLVRIASVITDYMQMLETDTTTRLILGELEGFEFTDNHLYAMVFTELPRSMNGFVMELPVNHTNATSPIMGSQFLYGSETVYLDSDTVAKFSLQANELRSLNQLLDRKVNENTTRIFIKDTADVIESEEIYINNMDVTLELSGKYTCDNFVVSGGSLNIRAINATNKLTLNKTNNFEIYLRRSGSLKITGSASLNTSTPNMSDNVNSNFIAFESNNAFLVLINNTITNEQNYTLKVGTQGLTTPEIYFSNVPLNYMEHNFTLKDAFGWISNANKDLHVEFRLPKKIQGTVTVTGSMVARGISGYLDNANDPVDLSNFTIGIFKSDEYTIELVIKHSDSSAFTNTTNNTPVIVRGTFNFHWE